MFPAAPATDFAALVRGRQPRPIDRELPMLLQDNYAIADMRRGTQAGATELPGTWVRLNDDDVRAIGIDPALLHNARTGFDASFYRNAEGRVVLAFTGTDEGRDWKHNIGQGVGLDDRQYNQAIVLGRRAREQLGRNVVFSGHSLGGGLAAAAAMVVDVPAVTFNAAGVHDHTLERYGLDASAARQQAEQGLVRSYHVRNELLTHLQEDSIPLKWAMPDAAGHAIELPDPDPLGFFERLVPGRMLMHRLDLHFIDSVMQAQDLAQPQASARGAGATPRAAGDAGTSNRLLVDAVGGLAAQRPQLGLADHERFLNAAAGMAARARLDGLERIDHVVPSVRGDGVFAVQGALADPAHRRSQVELELVARTPARDSAAVLRAQDALQASVQQPEARQHRAVLA
ncbi:MAG TPA: XVIPCD domain-containing protein [Luteimonas sp.]|nr:XVIPCD domain-containing protein [Luteimonas sp.]